MTEMVSLMSLKKNENSLMEDSEFDSLTNRESHALCLNRRLAAHRIIIISWLLETGLFEKTKSQPYSQRFTI